MGGKGGARHFAKPLVDQCLLFKAVCSNKDEVQDLGEYELVSRNQAINFTGLLQVHGLLQGLLKVSKSGQVQSGDLRTALLKMCVDSPEINNTNFKGEVWANLKQERICTLLTHFRRLKADQVLRKGAAKLKAADYLKLQKLVSLMDEKEEEKHVVQGKEPRKDRNRCLSHR